MGLFATIAKQRKLRRLVGIIALAGALSTGCARNDLKALANVHEKDRPTAATLFGEEKKHDLAKAAQGWHYVQDHLTNLKNASATMPLNARFTHGQIFIFRGLDVNEAYIDCSDRLFYYLREDRGYQEAIDQLTKLGFKHTVAEAEDERLRIQEEVDSLLARLLLTIINRYGEIKQMPNLNREAGNVNLKMMREQLLNLAEMIKKYARKGEDRGFPDTLAAIDKVLGAIEAGY